MRCPKCHYISFEGGDRCRNCGYEFSLSAVSEPEPAPELALNDRDEDPAAPIDLSLPRSAGAFDLPLFTGGDPDAPLIRPSAAPRAPLAVRRPTPDGGRLRSRYAVAEAPRLDLETAAARPGARAEDEAADAGRSAPSPSAPNTAAPPVRRLLAGVIDVAILGGINAGVLYFTLKLCALPLTAEGLRSLPIVPMAGFLLLLDGGYAVTFTAAVGQTIGKMAMRLRVVHLREDQDEDGGPDFAFAILRTAAYFASLLPAGLGFLPALFGKDRRALHDRLAETRVVTM
jgi:uncharacterized RDD family membrane protein YckC